MTSIGSFPAGLASGLTNAVADVNTALNQIKTVVNGNLDTANLAAGAGIVGTQFAAGAALANLSAGSVTDTLLASPNNVTYKQIIPSLALDSTWNVLTSGQTYLLSEGPQSLLQPSSSHAGVAVFYLDPAWYTAAGKTNKYNLRTSLVTNATAPTSTFTFGLYPVTAVAGGIGAVTLTLGTVTAGSTCVFAAPAGSTLVTPVSSGDFTAPAAGYFAIACAITVASTVANSAVAARAILQHRQV